MNNIINGLSPVNPPHEDYMEQALNPSFLQGKELSDEQNNLLKVLNEIIDRNSSPADKVREIAKAIKNLIKHFPDLAEEIINYAVDRTHTIANDRLKLNIALELVGLYAPTEANAEGRGDISEMQTETAESITNTI